MKMERGGVAGNDGGDQTFTGQGKARMKSGCPLQSITLSSVRSSGVSPGVNKSRVIQTLQNWRVTHAQLRKDRLTEGKAMEARSDRRLKRVEADG